MKELGWLGLYSNTKGGSLGSCGEKGASYKSAGALTMSDYMDVMQRFSALCCSDGENDDGHLEGIVNMLFFTKLELEESLPEEDQQQHSRPDALSVANKPYLTQDGETFPDKDCSASALVDGSGIEHTAREGENLAAEDKNSSSHDTKVSLPTALGAAAVEQIDEPLDSLPPVYGARLPMASYWGPLVSPGCVFSEKLSILDEDDDG
uniref:Uncharacterized protein n=1 Tax=Heterosigma akashiwo TaxID=2829 RepID=A0A6V1X684_HETAK